MHRKSDDLIKYHYLFTPCLSDKDSRKAFSTVFSIVSIASASYLTCIVGTKHLDESSVQSEVLCTLRKPLRRSSGLAPCELSRWRYCSDLDVGRWHSTNSARDGQRLPCVCPSLAHEPQIPFLPIHPVFCCVDSDDGQGLGPYSALTSVDSNFETVHASFGLLSCHLAVSLCMPSLSPSFHGFSFVRKSCLGSSLLSYIKTVFRIPELPELGQ